MRLLQEVQFLHPDLNMMHPDLRRLDLNLLLVFDALYRHRSVATAAHELALSPSALSHALARLRDAIGDALFVRLGNEMQPTVRADDIATWAGDALDTMSKGLARARRFDPAQSDRTFVFAATDYTAFAVLPAFLARIQHVAPRLRIRVVHSDRKISVDELAAGRIDFALGYHEESAADAPGLAGQAFQAAYGHLRRSPVHYEILTSFSSLMPTPAPPAASIVAILDPRLQNACLPCGTRVFR